jgi:hypothetical protein
MPSEAASGKSKRRILEEFIAATGYHEKSAIRVPTEPEPVTQLREATRQRLRGSIFTATDAQNRLIDEHFTQPL